MRIIETMQVICDDDKGDDFGRDFGLVAFAAEHVMWIRAHSKHVTSIVFVGDDRILVRMPFEAVVQALTLPEEG